MRFLLIGRGSIGLRHETILLDLGHEVVSVDPRPQTKANYRGICMPPGSNTHLAMASGEKFDGVLDCTPPDVRAGWLASAKARFIEKPLGGVPPAYHKPGAPAMVGFCYRWLPSLEAFVEELAAVRVFSLTIVAGQDLREWHDGDYRERYHGTPGRGGVVLDSLSHSLFIARWIMGDLELVGAVTGKFSGLDIRTEDTCAVLLRAATGQPVTALVDYLRRPRVSWIEAVTSDGVKRWQFDPADAGAMYERQMAVFAEICQGKRRYGFPDLQDGLIVQELLDKINV